MDIGSRIKRERDRRGWTPQELANRLTQAGLKITRQAVNAWELPPEHPQHTAPKREAITYLARVFTMGDQDREAPPERQATMRHYLEFGPARVEATKHLDEDAIEIAEWYQDGDPKIQKLVQDALQVGASLPAKRPKKGKKSQ